MIERPLSVPPAEHVLGLFTLNGKSSLEEIAMHSVLSFKDGSYYDDHRKATIEGEKFQALMDLCFAYGDTFSLRRCQWPGSHDGALEQALRPYLLGEYLSYETLICFDRKSREKCYLYSACQETKEILLRHIHHLFDREKSLAPADHQEYLNQKYNAFSGAYQAANDRWVKYLQSGGLKYPAKQRKATEREIFREAKDLWRTVFREEDYYSHMEDPCFFRGTELFFEAITHEHQCSVQVLSPAFEERLCELGSWADMSDEIPLPLFSLDTAEGWKQYKNGRPCEGLR